MMEKKKPIKLASLLAPPEEVELPNGTITTVKPFSGIAYDLYLEIEGNPAEHGHRIWELIGLCLPGVDEFEIRKLTPAECAAVMVIANGRIEEVKALAEKIEGNVQAPVTTAEPDPQTSLTLSDSSVSASLESSAVESTRSL